MIHSPFLSELFSLRDTLDQFANQTFSGGPRTNSNGHGDCHADADRCLRHR